MVTRFKINKNICLMGISKTEQIKKKFSILKHSA